MHTHSSKLNILGSNKFIITRNFSYNNSGILGRLPSKLVKVHSRSLKTLVRTLKILEDPRRIIKDLGKISKLSLKIFRDLGKKF